MKYISFKAPASVLNQFEDLISYLDKPARGKESRDEIMVRAILVWLSNQEVENFTSMKGDDNTPKGFLSLLGHKRSTYPSFFALLCRYLSAMLVLCYVKDTFTSIYLLLTIIYLVEIIIIDSR